MNGQQSQQTQQPVMMQFKCSQCQNEMVAPQPILRVFNSLDVSSVMFTHARAYKCPNCGTAYICLLNPQCVDAEGKLLFMWTPVQTQESAIVPGNNQTMQQAVKASEIEKKIKLN